MNLKIPSLAAAFVLTAAAAGAQVLPSPFETLGAYDVPVPWLNKDCQHAPCAVADQPQTAKAAPELPAAAKPMAFADDAPVYGPPHPGKEEGKAIAQLMASINGSNETGREAPRAVSAAAPANEVPNAETVVHVGGDQARYESGLFTFRQTIEAKKKLEAARSEINTPGQGFAAPGQIVNPNEGTSSFNGRPTRAVRNDEEPLGQ